MKKLLILTDFSPNATYAAEYGCHLANASGASLLLCNAISTPAELPQMDYVLWPLEDEADLKNASHLELMALKTHLEYQTSKGNYPVISSTNYIGPLPQVMTSIVRKQDIDLVVLGSHEDGLLKNLLLSNHCQQMIRETTVPLLIVPPTAPQTEVRRIAFATDLKNIKADLQHIFKLVGFARPLKAEILITHITDGGLSPQHTREHERLIREISNKADYPHIYYKVLDNTNAERGLAWICKHENIDILGLVPRKHNFLDSLIKGSLTQRMVKHIAMPLLVFPTR